MMQSTFPQPIRKEGCLFLAYCFVANIRTDSDVMKAFNFACSKGWLTKYSCYCNTGEDNFINGLCNYFGTKRMTGVYFKHVNNNQHWIVASSSTGRTVYDSIYGYKGTSKPIKTPVPAKASLIRKVANHNGKVEATSLNIRSKPSTSSSVVGSLNNNAKIVVGDEYLSPDGYIWYKTSKGYVHSGYILPTSGTKKAKIANCDAVNFRIGPSTSYKQNPNKKMLTVGTTVLVQGQANGFYKVSVGSDPRIVGYVSKQYVK